MNTDLIFFSQYKLGKEKKSQNFSWKVVYPGRYV